LALLMPVLLLLLLLLPLQSARTVHEPQRALPDGRAH
jgi:hypothetical protein